MPLARTNDLHLETPPRHLHAVYSIHRVDPLSLIAATLILAHLTVVGFYLRHSAISSLPFSSDLAHTWATSAYQPISMLFAALFLAFALISRRMRGPASICSGAIWLGYCATMATAAHFRIPPLSYTMSTVIGILTFGMASVLAAQWHGPDELQGG